VVCGVGGVWGVWGVWVCGRVGVWGVGGVGMWGHSLRSTFHRLHLLRLLLFFQDNVYCKNLSKVRWPRWQHLVDEFR
jgi:hypothetical protein